MLGTGIIHACYHTSVVLGATLKTYTLTAVMPKTVTCSLAEGVDHCLPTLWGPCVMSSLSLVTAVKQRKLAKATAKGQSTTVHRQ